MSRALGDHDPGGAELEEGFDCAADHQGMGIDMDTKGVGPSTSFCFNKIPLHLISLGEIPRWANP